MGVCKHSMLKHSLCNCEQALDGNEESRSGKCSNIELRLEGKKSVLLSADGAENAQKSFLPSKLPKKLQ